MRIAMTCLPCLPTLFLLIGRLHRRRRHHATQRPVWIDLVGRGGAMGWQRGRAAKDEHEHEQGAQHPPCEWSGGGGSEIGRCRCAHGCLLDRRAVRLGDAFPRATSLPESRQAAICVSARHLFGLGGPRGSFRNVCRVQDRHRPLRSRRCGTTHRRAIEGNIPSVSGCPESTRRCRRWNTGMPAHVTLGTPARACGARFHSSRVISIIVGRNPSRTKRRCAAALRWAVHNSTRGAP